MEANQNLCLSNSLGLVNEFFRLQKSKEFLTNLFLIKKHIPQANNFSEKMYNCIKEI